MNLPPHKEMVNLPDNPDRRLRLLAVVQRYKKSKDLRDKEFIEHIEKMAVPSLNSDAYRRVQNRFITFCLGLSFGADRAFRGGTHDKMLQEEYPSMINDVLIKVSNQLWDDFNPTGKSLTGCFIKWVNNKLRLMYMPLDWYRKTKGKGEVSMDEMEEFGRPLPRQDIESQIESDLKQDKADRVEALDSLRIDVETDSDKFWEGNFLMRDYRCNYKMLAQRLMLSPNTTNYGVKKAIAEELGFLDRYNTFNGQIENRFNRSVVSRRLEKNLFSPQDLETFKEILEKDKSLDKSCYNDKGKKWVEITPRYMATRHLPMFYNPPMSLLEIVEELRKTKPKTYSKLTEAKLTEIWEKKCVPKIAKALSRVSDYNQNSEF